MLVCQGLILKAVCAQPNTGTFLLANFQTYYHVNILILIVVDLKLIAVLNI